MKEDILERSIELVNAVYDAASAEVVIQEKLSILFNDIRRCRARANEALEQYENYTKSALNSEKHAANLIKALEQLGEKT
jgi:hypothetical protein